MSTPNDTTRLRRNCSEGRESAYPVGLWYRNVQFTSINTAATKVHVFPHPSQSSYKQRKPGFPCCKANASDRRKRIRDLIQNLQVALLAMDPAPLPTSDLLDDAEAPQIGQGRVHVRCGQLGPLHKLARGQEWRLRNQSCTRRADPARALPVVVRSRSSLNRSIVWVAASNAWFTVSATPVKKNSSQASQSPVSRTPCSSRLYSVR